MDERMALQCDSHQLEIGELEKLLSAVKDRVEDLEFKNSTVSWFLFFVISRLKYLENT